MLLDAGADVNAQGGEYGNALYAAVEQGSEQVVKMLLDAGADVNAQGGEYGNALYAAVSRGSEQVVKMLLDAGADVNAQGGEYGNALYAAVEQGSEQVVKMLLDAGADVNTQGGEYGNALRAAKRNNDEKVVKMLLSHRADADAGRKEEQPVAVLPKSPASIDLREGLPSITSDANLDKSCSISDRFRLYNMLRVSLSSLPHLDRFLLIGLTFAAGVWGLFLVWPRKARLFAAGSV
jgi:ankyrin repeat protein